MTPSDHKGLVGRLREEPRCQCAVYAEVKITDEAAAAIEALSREKEELVAEPNKLTVRCSETEDEIATNLENATDHNHWSQGLIDPSPERVRELVRWAERTLWTHGWTAARDFVRAEAAEARVSALTARLAMAEEVLRPFAAEADKFNPEPDPLTAGGTFGFDDGDLITSTAIPCDLTVGHLRAARSFLENKDGLGR